MLVRSLGGKNSQDRDKADKVNIPFPATPKDNCNVFGGVMKKSEKFNIPGGGGKLHFLNNGSECLFMLYFIIVFNNEELMGYFSKTRTGQQIHWHFKLDIIILAEKNWQPLTRP